MNPHNILDKQQCSQLQQHVARIWKRKVKWGKKSHAVSLIKYILTEIDNKYLFFATVSFYHINLFVFSQFQSSLKDAKKMECIYLGLMLGVLRLYECVGS